MSWKNNIHTHTQAQLTESQSDDDLCADSGADRDPGEDHCGSRAGHPRQRGPAEGGPVPTLPALPATQHGAVQGPGSAQVNPLCSFASSLPSPRLSSSCLASLVCSLEEEARQLDAALASLCLQLAEARGCLSRLETSRVSLERDISCKSNSLFIERDKCMKRRERYPTTSVLSGYWGVFVWFVCASELDLCVVVMCFVLRSVEDMV